MFSNIVKSVNESSNTSSVSNKVAINKKCSGNTASSCDGPNQAGGGCNIM